MKTLMIVMAGLIFMAFAAGEAPAEVILNLLHNFAGGPDDSANPMGPLLYRTGSPTE